MSDKNKTNHTHEVMTSNEWKRRHPTRMHEVLGVETGELFSIYEFADDELAYVDTNGNVLNAKNNIPVGPYTLTVAINGDEGATE